jgi:hypothetical protein
MAAFNFDDALKEYLAKGGKITKCKPGVPKDLARMKRQYGLFGGQRRYKASVALRVDGKDHKYLNF